MDEANKSKNEIFSKSVRAGKRTYFFDVKSTQDENLYVTVTESKRRFKDDGGFFYEKHKLFLYKEDFIKFTEGLNEVVEYIRKNNPTPVVEQVYVPSENPESKQPATEITTAPLHEFAPPAPSANDSMRASAEHITPTTGEAPNHNFTDISFEDLDK